MKNPTVVLEIENAIAFFSARRGRTAVKLREDVSPHGEGLPTKNGGHAPNGLADRGNYVKNFGVDFQPELCT